LVFSPETGNKFLPPLVAESACLVILGRRSELQDAPRSYECVFNTLFTVRLVTTVSIPAIMSAEGQELENLRFADAFNPAQLRYNCFFVALGRVSHVDSKMLAALASDDESKVDEACGADHNSALESQTPPLNT
jgi:hypothetical protein